MDEVWWGNKIRLEEILKANMEHHGTSNMFVWKGGHVCADHAALVSLVFHFRWQCYNYSMSSLRVVYWLKSQLFHWTWGVVSFQWIACVCVCTCNQLLIPFLLMMEEIAHQLDMWIWIQLKRMIYSRSLLGEMMVCAYAWHIFHYSAVSKMHKT